MSLNKLIDIKGIGPSAIEKLKNFGIKDLEELKTLSEETLLKEVNLPTNVVAAIMTLGGKAPTKPEEPKKEETKDSKPKPEVKLSQKQIEEANEQFKLTRQYQQSYDEKTMGMIYKYNKFECNYCKHDIRIRRLAFWQEPETGKTYLRLTAICNPNCMENIKSFRLTPMSMADLEKENPSFLPE